MTVDLLNEMRQLGTVTRDAVLTWRGTCPACNSGGALNIQITPSGDRPSCRLGCHVTQILTAFTNLRHAKGEAGTRSATPCRDVADRTTGNGGSHASNTAHHGGPQSEPFPPRGQGDEPKGRGSIHGDTSPTSTLKVPRARLDSSPYPQAGGISSQHPGSAITAIPLCEENRGASS